MWIAECEKFSDGIKDIIESNKRNRFILTTEKYTFYKLFESYFKDYENVLVINQSIYLKLLFKEKVDLVFSVPNIGMKSYFENKSIKKGTTLMNINPNDIKEMEVPLLDMEKQNGLFNK